MWHILTNQRAKLMPQNGKISTSGWHIFLPFCGYKIATLWLLFLPHCGKYFAIFLFELFFLLFAIMWRFSIIWQNWKSSHKKTVNMLSQCNLFMHWHTHTLTARLSLLFIIFLSIGGEGSWAILLQVPSSLRRFVLSIWSRFRGAGYSGRLLMVCLNVYFYHTFLSNAVGIFFLIFWLG